MAKLTKAVDLQARHDEILMLKESGFCTFEEDEVFQLHERIDDLMGKTAALTAENERLTAPVRSVDAMRMLQEARIHGLQTILTKWLAARATAPATSVEEKGGE